MPVPPFPSRKGKRSWIHDIGGNPVSYEVVDEHIWSPKDNEEKALCVHKLRFDDGREEYRIGYYMIGRKGRGKGKWLWAQYAPMMHAADLKHLFGAARKNGWVQFTSE